MSNPNSIQEVPKLETARLILRGFTLEDSDDIFEYASDTDVNLFMPWHIHRSKDETLEFLQKSDHIFKTSDCIDWGIELKSVRKIIGGISIREWNDQNRCADVGYVLSKKFWGKGYTTEVLKEVIKFGFEKLNANRIEAHCDEDNVASFKVMEKVGMKYEGTLRRKVLVKNKFVNMKFYSILRSEFFNEV